MESAKTDRVLSPIHTKQLVACNLSQAIFVACNLSVHTVRRSVCVAERLALPTSDHGVAGSNPAEGEILPEPKRRFTAQSLSCSPFHRLEMTEILLKERKTLTHPSIHTVRQVAEIFTCKIFPAKTCLEHVEVCMITMVLSVEKETVIMHCFIAFAVRHLQRTRLERNCWTWIL